MENTKNKRKLRGVLAALVAIALATACVPALAAFAAPADATNDSLPPSTGNLIIHKYQSDDMSKIGSANDGTEVTVDSSFTALSGVTFNIYKVSANASGDYPSKAPYRLSDNGTTLTDGDGDTFTVAAASTASVTTDANGKATASNLAQGVYLVVEQETKEMADKVADIAEPFVVAVPMTAAAGNTDGNTWLTDVHVYPKNQQMYVNKFLTGSTKDDAANGTQSGSAINVGDTVHYSIVPTIPDGVVAYKVDDDGTPVSPTTVTAEDAKVKYKITDTLDEALTYTANSVKVYGLSATEAADKTSTATGGTAIDASNYTVTCEGQELVVEFNATGRLALYTANYACVRVDFDAVANSKLLDKVDENGNPTSLIENTGYVKFTNKFGTEKTRNSKTNSTPDRPVNPDSDGPNPIVHTAHISITKKDASNAATTLSGAKFKIADTEANAKTGKYLRKTTDGAVVDPSDSRWADATDWEATSGNDGVFTFDGVEDYTSEIGADGTETNKVYYSYYLVETQAPDGYNLPADPFKIKFSATTSTKDTNWTVYKDVTNTNEFTLPLTGGMGTILLTLAGVVLIGGAAVAFVAASRKKKGAHEQQ